MYHMNFLRVGVLSTVVMIASTFIFTGGTIFLLIDTVSIWANSLRMVLEAILCFAFLLQYVLYVLLDCFSWRSRKESLIEKLILKVSVFTPRRSVIFFSCIKLVWAMYFWVRLFPIWNFSILFNKILLIIGLQELFIFSIVRELSITLKFIYFSFSILL